MLFRGPHGLIKFDNSPMSYMAAKERWNLNVRLLHVKYLEHDESFYEVR